MGNLSAHFSTSEFTCKCGCGFSKVDNTLIDKLEKLRTLCGNKPITITSGCRCSQYSPKVSGFTNDAHTKGIAADIIIPGMLPADVAAAAEKVGFSGIGIMKDATHVDVRNDQNYYNNHWFGNEVTGDDHISTFIKSTNKHTITVNYDGVEIFRKEV